MIRIIEVLPGLGENAPKRAAERREIINKISIRSNLQNPIKKWNLVANDDFQMDLYRYFRRKGLFYERRDREWKERSRQLKSVKINKGPNIKTLTAYLACFYWKNPRLGPAIAKDSLGDLFEGDEYDFINKTEASKAYQMYLLGSLVEKTFRGIAVDNKSISNKRSHLNLIVFTLIVKVFTEQGVKWGKEIVTVEMEKQLNDWGSDFKKWFELVRWLVNYVLKSYKKAARKAKIEEEVELTLKNFVKRHGDVTALLQIKTPPTLRKLAVVLAPVD